MSFTQLYSGAAQMSQNEGSQISSLLKAEIGQAEIARILGRSPSTISRENLRNTGKRGSPEALATYFFPKVKTVGPTHLR